MTKRLTVAVLYGGCSAEHDISIKSAKNICAQLDRERFEVVPIWISREGQWHFVSPDQAPDTFSIAPHVALLPQPVNGKVYFLSGEETDIFIDVVFPVVHGTNGEDGTLQGVLELAKLPYVGPGVAATAVCMDKIMTKMLFQQVGLPITKFVPVLYQDFQKDPETIQTRCESYLNYPFYVKPANLGSSIGIHKVETPDGFMAALKDAFKYDLRVIIEEGVSPCRDIELAVMGNSTLRVSTVAGEIVLPAGFYDFEAKDKGDGVTYPLPAVLSPEVLSTMQSLAIEAYKVTGCVGGARLDFLLRDTDNAIFISEINTIPGYTSTSLFPKLWQHEGMSFSLFLTQLIDLALEHFKTQQTKLTSFESSQPESLA